MAPSRNSLALEIHKMKQLSAMPMSQRFRGYLPVVVDIETGGFDASRHALLEIAAVILRFDEHGKLTPFATHHEHIEPEKGTSIDPKAIEFIGMDPYHPLRFAQPENDVMRKLFRPIREEIKEQNCQRAVLVGHNSWFDLSFINAAVDRHCIQKNPFHRFTSLDTATLGTIFCGQSVLARVAEAIDQPFDPQQAHSAKYDAESTAKIFCHLVNKFHQMSDLIP